MNRSALEIFTGSPERSTALAVEHLTLSGFMVVPPDDLQAFEVERPSDFCLRLRISHSHFVRRLSETDCPAFESQQGPSGRIVKLRSNHQLERHMMKRDTRFRKGHK